MMDMDIDDDDTGSIGRLIQLMYIESINQDLLPGAADVEGMIRFLDDLHGADIVFEEGGIAVRRDADTEEQPAEPLMQENRESNCDENANEQDDDFILHGLPSCTEIQEVLNRTLKKTSYYLPHYDELKQNIYHFTEKVRSNQEFTPEELKLFSETIEAAHLRIVLRNEIHRMDNILPQLTSNAATETTPAAEEPILVVIPPDPDGEEPTLNALQPIPSDDQDVLVAGDPTFIENMPIVYVAGDEEFYDPVSEMLQLPIPEYVGPEGNEEYLGTTRNEMAAILDCRDLAHQMLEEQEESKAMREANLRRSNALNVDQVAPGATFKRLRKNDGTF